MSKLFRCAEDDPNRCQGTYTHGQCPYLAMSGCTYCPMHGGPTQQMVQAKRAVHDYRLQTWQERVDDLAASVNVKNLRGEIGLLRMTLEQLLLQAKTPQQLLIFSEKIQSLTRDVKSLVEVCQKIEERNKELLSKIEIMNIADFVVNLLSEYLEDSDALLMAGERLHEFITGIVSGSDTRRFEPKVSLASKPLGQ